MGRFRAGSSPGFDLSAAQRTVDEAVLQLCGPYLPVDTGSLRDSGVVLAPGKVGWTAAHASAVYGRPGGQWVERMLAGNPGALAAHGAAALGGRVRG